MDEYGVPTESWAVVNARNQKKYNSMLFGGMAFLGITMTYCWFSEHTTFYMLPRHLIDLENDRLLVNFDKPDPDREQEVGLKPKK